MLVANNDPTSRFEGRHVETLAECDRVVTYEECGWFCVLGYKGGERVVHAHANRAEDVVREAEARGYRWTGRGPVRMTPEEARKARASLWGKFRGAA